MEATRPPRLVRREQPPGPCWSWAVDRIFDEPLATCCLPLIMAKLRFKHAERLLPRAGHFETRWMQGCNKDDTNVKHTHDNLLSVECERR